MIFFCLTLWQQATQRGVAFSIWPKARGSSRNTRSPARRFLSATKYLLAKLNRLIVSDSVIVIYEIMEIINLTGRFLHSYVCCMGNSRLLIFCANFGENCNKNAWNNTRKSVRLFSDTKNTRRRPLLPTASFSHDIKKFSINIANNRHDNLLYYLMQTLFWKVAKLNAPLHNEIDTSSLENTIARASFLSQVYASYLFLFHS